MVTTHPHDKDIHCKYSRKEIWVYVVAHDIRSLYLGTAWGPCGVGALLPIPVIRTPQSSPTLPQFPQQAGSKRYHIVTLVGCVEIKQSSPTCFFHFLQLSLFSGGWEKKIKLKITTIPRILYNYYKDVSSEFDDFTVDTHLCKLRCWYL